MFQSRSKLVPVVVFFSLVFASSAQATYFCAGIIKPKPKVSADVIEMVHMKRSGPNQEVSLQGHALKAGYKGAKRSVSPLLAFWETITFQSADKKAKRRLEDRLNIKFGGTHMRQVLAQPIVDLSNLDLTDGELKSMIKHFSKETTQLDLSGNPKITNEGIHAVLLGTSGVQKLNLSGTKARLKGKLWSLLRDRFLPIIRELSIDGIRRGDLKKIARFEDLRKIDIHKTYSVVERKIPWLTLGPSISVGEIVWFLNNKPKNFYEIILPGGQSNINATLIQQRVKPENIIKNIKFKYAYKDLSIKNWINEDVNGNLIGDGDSIRILLNGESAFFSEVIIRIYGVNTGEMTAPFGSAEHKLALAAANFVEIYRKKAKSISITHGESDKYGGRMVAQIWVNLKGEKHPVNLADELIRHGLGIPYYGGTKQYKASPRIWQHLFKANEDFIDELVERGPHTLNTGSR